MVLVNTSDLLIQLVADVWTELRNRFWKWVAKRLYPHLRSIVLKDVDGLVRRGRIGDLPDQQVRRRQPSQYRRESDQGHRERSL